jgi:hypothetical protein
MAEADPTNSLVPSGKAYIYVIGGQKVNTDTPGGTNTVYMAGVDPTTGAVGTGTTTTPFPNVWTALPNTLPQALLGASATVHGCAPQKFNMGLRIPHFGVLPCRLYRGVLLVGAAV